MKPAATHFAAVKEILTKVGVPFTLNDRLVRGLDYYHPHRLAVHHRRPRPRRMPSLGRRPL